MDTKEKIKSFARRTLANRELFPAVLMIVVGVLSFGLGRLSVDSQGVAYQKNLSSSQPAQVSSSGSERKTEERVTKSRPESDTLDAKKNETVAGANSTSASVSSEGEESTTGKAGSETSEKKYVASKNGTKYHLPWCSGAARIKEENKVWFASKEEAEKAGYTPAANCKGI